MPFTRRNKWLIGLAVFIALLVGARLALPDVVEHFVNQRLNTLNAYRGHVADIDIHLWRGAYSIDGIEIVKKGASRPVPFFKARASTCRWNGAACGKGRWSPRPRFCRPS